MLRLLVLVLALVVCSAPVVAQEPVDGFLRELRTAVRTGDRRAVAARVRFPITVSMAGLRIPFADAAAFLERYDDIFTPALVDTIARSKPTVGADGFAIGNNALIMTPIDGRFVITAITVPPTGPGSGVSTAAGGTTSSPAGAKGGRRVSIRGGPRPTQFSGSLPRGGADVYLLFVPKGRLLEVRLERVPGREALVRVVHSTTGAPLNPRTAGGARIVTGMPTEDADYRIEVRRTDESDDPEPLHYIVSLFLK